MRNDPITLTCSSTRFRRFHRLERRLDRLQPSSTGSSGSGSVTPIGSLRRQPGSLRSAAGRQRPASRRRRSRAQNRPRSKIEVIALGKRDFQSGRPRPAGNGSSSTGCQLGRSSVRAAGTSPNSIPSISSASSMAPGTCAAAKSAERNLEIEFGRQIGRDRLRVERPRSEPASAGTVSKASSAGAALASTKASGTRRCSSAQDIGRAAEHAGLPGAVAVRGDVLDPEVETSHRLCRQAAQIFAGRLLIGQPGVEHLLERPGGFAELGQPDHSRTALERVECAAQRW